MAKKIKLPKRIAGVKVPKEMRKTVERAIETAQGPAGQEMIAAALSLAAASATAALVRARGAQDSRGGDGRRDDGPEAGSPPVPPTPPRPPRPPQPPLAPVTGAPPTPPRPPAGAAARSDGQQMADAFGQVAEQVLGRLFGGRG